MTGEPHPGLEALPHGFLMLDSATRVSYWNAAAESLLGVRRSDALGEMLTELLPGLDSSEVRTALDRTRRTGDDTITISEVCATGEPSPLKFTISPAEDDGLIVQVELTDMADLEERYAALLESIRHGFIAVDPDWNIIYLNSVAESLLRMSRDRAIGTGLLPILPREPESIREKLRATMEDGIQRHLSSVQPQGRVFRGRVFDVWTSPLPGGGISVLFEDVSDRVRYEKELARLAEEAAEANRAKSRFFAAISHELRTPLNAIIGYIYLLTSETYGEMPDAALRAAERSAVCAEHLARLIDDVLLMTTAEIDRLPVTPTPVELPRLLPSLVEPHRQQAEAKNLEFELDAPDDLPVVETDPQRLRQLIGALLSNAIKFTNSGEVRVTARATDGDGETPLYSLFPEPRVEISVSDTGVGIPEEDQNRIFEAFEQIGDPARSDSMVRGTGLGLTVASKLAHRLGGSIRLNSKPDRGSSFTISLPLRYSAEEMT